MYIYRVSTYKEGVDSRYISAVSKWNGLIQYYIAEIGGCANNISVCTMRHSKCYTELFAL